MYSESYWAETGSDFVLSFSPVPVTLPFDTIIQDSPQGNWNTTEGCWEINSESDQDRYYMQNITLILKGLGNLYLTPGVDTFCQVNCYYYTASAVGLSARYYIYSNGVAQQKYPKGDTIWKTSGIIKVAALTPVPYLTPTLVWYDGNEASPTPTVTIGAGSSIVTHFLY